MILGALRAVLFACIAAMMFTSPASAVQWVGKFDPLSVLGQGLFQYSDDPSCGTDGIHFFSALCDPVILALTADVIDDNNTATTSDDSAAHLDFGALFPVDLNDYFISGGQLVGVDILPPVGFVFPTSCTGPNAASLCGPWWFDWFAPFDLSDPVVFFQGTCVGGEFPGCFFNPQAPTVIAETITFTRVGSGSVPEPGTLGLLLGGVAAAWFARRRKRVA